MVVRRILQFNFAETRAGFSAFLNHWSEWLKKQFHCFIKRLHWWPKHSLFTRSKQIINCLGFQWPDGFNFEIFWHVILLGELHTSSIYCSFDDVQWLEINILYCSMFTFNTCHYTVLLSPGSPKGCVFDQKIKTIQMPHLYLYPFISFQTLIPA